MALDTTEATTTTDTDSGTDSEFRTFNVRVHRSVPDHFDVGAALEVLAGDQETYGKLHFTQKNPRVGKKSGKLGPSLITVDTVPSRRASGGSAVDADAQKLMARVIRQALSDPRQSKLRDVSARQARGEKVDQSEILAAFDPSAIAELMAAMEPSKRGRKANA
jgi:hypothetical protein